MKLLYQDNHGYRFTKDHRKLDFPPHIHEAVELCYFLEGESTVQYGTEKYKLYAGDLFFAFPNQIHGYEDSKNVYGYIMILQPKVWLKPYYKLLTEKLPQSPVLRKGSFEHTAIAQLMDMAFADQNTVSREVLQGYFAVIFGKLLSLLTLTEAENNVMQRILMYIHDHYREPVTRRDIAKAAGYTESHVSHLFSAAMRTSLPDYINALRAEDAKELLLTTDMSISQIAENLGFGSIRNFGRVFRKCNAIAPKDYRKKHEAGTVEN